MKMAATLKRAKVTPQAAFAEFDKSKDGSLDKREFKQCLNAMRIYDLDTHEQNAIWEAIDVDRSGSISLEEFARKLELYGVRNQSREEMIFTQMVQAMQRTHNVKTPARLFETIDKFKRGYIDRQDFSDIFENMGLQVNKQELERFMDNFWKDKQAGIDYNGFLRIFAKYQLAAERDNKIKKPPKAVSDQTLVKKKELYTQLDDAFKKTGKNINELFHMVDDDNS